MTENQIIILALSLGLGLLVGMQREKADSKIAGVRTFALITLLGTISGFLSEISGDYWLVAAGVVGLSMLLVGANVIKSNQNTFDPGQTTEVAILLMYMVGAYLVIGDKTIAVILGGVTAILLHLKSTLETFIGNLQQKDIKAIMQFVAISLVILPILPNRSFGRYDVLNPFNVWLMVVFIVGIGIFGYFIYKWVGTKAGTISNAILGGLISSTATTATYAKMTDNSKNIEKLAIFIILTASAISFIRVIFEVGVVVPEAFGEIAPPLIATTIAMVIICSVLYYHIGKGKEEDKVPELENPAQLKSALLFGFLYAVITFAVAATKDYFGQSGLYTISVISGLTDVDAITLSLSNQIKNGGLGTGQGWKLILTAALSNMLFKGGLAAFLGSQSLRNKIWFPFSIAIISGIVILLIWPEGWMF